MKRSLNLDVDSPDKVSSVLRDAADAYYESAGEVEAAWGDKSAGKPWDMIAKKLESAADQIDKGLDKMGY